MQLFLSLALLLLVILGLLIPRKRSLGLSLGLAESILVLLPSSIFRSLQGGALYPILLSVVLIVFGLVKHRKPLQVTRSFKLVFAIYFITAISTLTSESVDWFYLPQCFFAPLIFLTISNLSESEAKNLAKVTLWLGILETLLAVPEVLIGKGPFLGQQITVTVENHFLPGLIRAQGTLDHPLVLSLILLLGLSFLQDLNFDIYKKVIAGSVLLVGIFLTGSVSAAITALLLIVWLAFGQKNHAVKILATCMICLSGIWIVFSGAQIPESLSREVNFSHRTASLQAVPNLVTMREPLNAIFGSGVGSIRTLFENGVIQNDGFFVVDNQYVSTLVASGLVGLMFFAWLIYLTVRNSSPSKAPSVFVLLFMALSFDYLLWYSLLIPVFFVLGQRFGVRKASEMHPSGLDLNIFRQPIVAGSNPTGTAKKKTS